MQADEALLVGETMTTISNGTARFELQFGQNVLSSKMGKKKFCVRLEPTDDELRHAYPNLSVATEPVKSVTKIERKPPPPMSKQLEAMAEQGLSQLDAASQLPGQPQPPLRPWPLPQCITTPCPRCLALKTACTVASSWAGDAEV